MKRIIVAAAVVVGFAGAVAFKANHKDVTYYFKNPQNSNACTAQTFSTTPCPTGSNTCTFDFGSPIGTQTLYTESTCNTVATRS